MHPPFEATTHGITVAVRVSFLIDQSHVESNRFVWAYRINIINRSPITVQLLRRTWHITDAHFRTQIIQGDGVIGEQPVLEPGESFEYTSGTPLGTPSGFMTGKYHMLAVLEGSEFDIAIPAFSLDSPYENTRLH